MNLPCLGLHLAYSPSLQGLVLWQASPLDIWSHTCPLAALRLALTLGEMVAAEGGDASQSHLVPGWKSCPLKPTVLIMVC